MIPIERSCHKEHTYEILITCHLKDMANVEVFKKWVKLQGQGHKVKKIWYQYKDLVIKNTHMKYESPITYHSKDMANVSFCKVGQISRSRSQGQKCCYQ
jgi:hypothetical protein